MSRWTYQPADFFLLRTPTFPIDDLLDTLAGQSSNHGPSGGAMLAALFAWSVRPEVAQAIAAASESLYSTVRSGGPPAGDTARTERIRSSLLRYLVRATTRPTPFGLLAAVGVGSIVNDPGDAIGVRLAAHPVRRTRTATDLSWLRTLLRQEEPEVRLRGNDLICRGEHRIFLPAGATGTSRAIACTPFIERGLAHARTGVTVDELCRLLRLDFPELPEGRVRQAVERLREHEVLVPEPSIGLLGRTVEQPAIAVLDNARRLAAEADSALPSGNGEKALAALRSELRALTPDHEGDVIRVDTALATVRASLPRTVADAAATVASATMALAPQGYPTPLADHLQAFVERYGERAEVPVRHVLSAELGIGPPTGYTRPPRTHPLPTGRRETNAALSALLLARLADPNRAKRTEIELTDADLAGLSQDSTDQRPPIPVLDVHLQLTCEPGTTLDHGTCRAILTRPGLVPGGRTFGRFAAGVLADELPDRLAELARHEERVHPDLIFAELNYLPNSGHLSATAERPAIRGYEIPINVVPAAQADRVIEVDDLLLAVADDRYLLRSVRLDREVVVTQGHLLMPDRAPNLCRFLLDVSQARWRTPGQVSWGIAEGSPYLPRVTYRGIVLRRAQWSLPAEVMSGATASDATLADWLTRNSVDRWVSVGEPDGVLADNRMLLDTGRDWGRRELARQARALRNDQRLTLEEALPDVDQAWVTDERNRRYAAEFVIPVRLDLPKATPAGQPPRHRVHRDDRVWTGEEWTFVRLYGREQDQNRLITDPMAELLATLRDAGFIDLAFFIRYRDPAPHLRFRLHSTTRAAPGQVLSEVATWTARLARSELVGDVVFAPYQREVVRYGGLELLALAERVFTEDSDLVRGLLARPAPAPAWTEMVACLDHLAGAWGLTTTERLTLARALPSDPGAGVVFRRHRDELTDLLRDSVPSPVRERIGRLGRELAEATTAIATRCAALNTPAAVRGEIMYSLLHLHANRRGLRLSEERLALGVWQRCLAAAVHLDGC